MIPNIRTPGEAILGMIELGLTPVKQRKAADGDTLVLLHNGRVRRIRCKRTMNKAYHKTRRFPAIQHAQIIDANPLEWEEA